MENFGLIGNFAVSMDKPFVESISNDTLAQLPPGAFPGRIVVVDTTEAVAEACKTLARSRVIGFDTETRPSFTKGVSNKVSLLQLSSEDQAFLFRLNRIALEKPLLQLLSSRNVIKVGAAVRDDLRALKQLRKFTPGGFVELQNLAPLFGITDKSLRKLGAIALRIRISKAQRLSNWEARQLTPAQQMYAATDAWIGRAIYMEFMKRRPAGVRMDEIARYDDSSAQGNASR